MGMITETLTSATAIHPRFKYSQVYAPNLYGIFSMLITVPQKVSMQLIIACVRNTFSMVN
jgi:hypothetical protein